jgi:uncharacterized protein YdhG (YjbR/CyaY superfamily)
MNPDVQAYIESGSAGQQKLYRSLETLISDLFPDLKCVMSAQIPTYRGPKGWIALGYSEEDVTLYTEGPQHVSEFRKRHPEIKSGKSSITFKTGEDLPNADIAQVVRHAIEETDKPRPGRRGRR